MHATIKLKKVIDIAENTKRLHIICGHFGSGKTEFSINYAIRLSKFFEKNAVCDLDIINMYFRLREKKDVLEKKNIKVFSSVLDPFSNLDIPALDPAIAAPIEDKNCNCILDCGGDPKGALVLRRYLNIIGESENIFVINANRPETDTPEKAISFIKQIESFSGIKANKIVNTTHMLKNTSKRDVLKGAELCKKVGEITGLEIKYHVAVSHIADEIINDPQVCDEIKKKIFPINLYFRNDRMF